MTGQVSSSKVICLFTVHFKRENQLKFAEKKFQIRINQWSIVRSEHLQIWSLKIAPPIEKIPRMWNSNCMSEFSFFRIWWISYSFFCVPSEIRTHTHTHRYMQYCVCFFFWIAIDLICSTFESSNVFPIRYFFWHRTEMIFFFLMDFSLFSRNNFCTFIFQWYCQLIAAAVAAAKKNLVIKNTESKDK